MSSPNNDLSSPFPFDYEPLRPLVITATDWEEMAALNIEVLRKSRRRFRPLTLEETWYFVNGPEYPVAETAASGVSECTNKAWRHLLASKLRFLNVVKRTGCSIENYDRFRRGSAQRASAGRTWASFDPLTPHENGKCIFIRNEGPGEFFLEEYDYYPIWSQVISAVKLWKDGPYPIIRVKLSDSKVIWIMFLNREEP